MPNMYLIVTFSIKILSSFFRRHDFPACLLVFASSLLPVSLGSSNNPPIRSWNHTRGLPVQQLAAVLPRCTSRDFDAKFRAAWLILLWTSQAACGSSQTFFHRCPGA